MPDYWSPSLRGFYCEEQERPADAVAVRPARRLELLAESAATGRAIITLPSGKPGLGPAAAPLREQVRRRIKREAARRIEAVAPLWRQLNDCRLLLREEAQGVDADARERTRARFACVDAIRAASALIEADLDDTATAALRDFPVANHPAWPNGIVGIGTNGEVA